MKKKIICIGIVSMFLLTGLTIASEIESNKNNIQDYDCPYNEYIWEYTIKICGEKKVLLKLNNDKTTITITRLIDNTTYQANYIEREGKYLEILVYKANLIGTDPSENSDGGCTGGGPKGREYNAYYINVSSENYNSREKLIYLGFNGPYFYETYIRLDRNSTSNVKIKQIMFNSFDRFPSLQQFKKLLNL
jgi:hypothetical protein